MNDRVEARPQSASGRSPVTPQKFMPPRVLPLLYFGFAHVALVSALVAVAVDPSGVAGFFYHARMLAIVHLVTLGWISMSILGALYIVGPLALRMPMPARRMDYVAWAAAVSGVAGMVSHFWIEEGSGMAYSAAMVTLAFAWVGSRTVRGLRRAPVPREVKLHIVLAFANLFGAAVFGVMLGVDKMSPFLPGEALSNVFAHAHLAGIGWAVMMAVGVGYRLFPMVLPSAMPTGRWIYASAALLEVGVIGLFVGLMARSVVVASFAVCVLIGIGVFIGEVIWMRRHPRPVPPDRPLPDYGVRHAVLAVVYLAASAICGAVLALSPRSEWTLRVALVYGVLALIGFLGQLVAGMEARLLPLHAWYWAFARSGWQGPVPPPHRMPIPKVQQTAFYLWSAGVPCVAIGLYANAVPFLAVGAWLLLGGVTLGSINGIAIVRHAFGPDRASLADSSGVAESIEPNASGS